MSPHYQLLPRAWGDLRTQLAYIAERNPSAAARYRQALEQAFEQTAAHPYAAPCYPARLALAVGIRVKPVPGFGRYRLFYRVLGKNAVEIVRILHTSRDLSPILQGRI